MSIEGRPLGPPFFVELAFREEASGAMEHGGKEFFGRRKGKKLRTYHSHLIHEILPNFQIRSEEIPVAISETIDNPSRELVIEIGFGGGEHLAHLARINPAKMFIGCEPFVNGVAKLLAEIDANDLKNVNILVDDARQLIARLPDASVDRIYLLYPDPWPKTRQKKRRFINAETLEQMARILKPSGELRFATDIDDYSAWSLQRIAQIPEFNWKNAAVGEWTKPWDEWVSTRYEQKAIREGRAPVYLIFERTQLPAKLKTSPQ
jgi:tRNA (guanine-N7-)-methyltransferase